MRRGLIVVCLTLLVTSLPALALDWAGLSGRDASRGLKDALGQGIRTAVSTLGKPDGFLGSPPVRIPLPEPLDRAEGALRMFGQGDKVDQLVITMNRAAEAAVPEALSLLEKSLRQMSVSDAKTILSGGDDAATRYFERSTRSTLHQRFLPVVRQATQRLDTAQAYNRVADKAVKYRLLDQKDADLESYVTRRTLDGLFLMIAEQERSLRRDPIGAASDIARKVFGLVPNP